MRSRSQAGLLELLGGFRLFWGGAEFSLPPQAASLVAFLAIQERPVHRSVLAGTFWAGIPEHRALANLRSALHRIPAPVISVMNSHLHMRTDLRVDFREASELARDLVGSKVPPQEIGLIVNVLERDLLPDADEGWLEPERQRYRRLRLRGLTAVGGLLLQARRSAEAVEVAQTAVSIEPLSDKAEHLLISALIADGNASLAAREYRDYRRRLWRELRVSPAPELTSLLEPQAH